jgi:hypothetical protein
MTDTFFIPKGTHVRIYKNTNFKKKKIFTTKGIKFTSSNLIGYSNHKGIQTISFSYNDENNVTWIIKVPIVDVEFGKQKSIPGDTRYNKETMRYEKFDGNTWIPYVTSNTTKCHLTQI